MMIVFLRIHIVLMMMITILRTFWRRMLPASISSNSFKLSSAAALKGLSTGEYDCGNADNISTSCFRDIKPENVLVNLITNKVTLIDFGSGDFIQENFYTTYDGTQHSRASNEG